MNDPDNKTLIAVTVTADTARQMRERMTAAAAAGADLVELRLDYLRDVGGHTIEELLADRPCPVIVTVRAVWEGGRFGGSEAERLRLLIDAARAGADYIDLEYAAWRESGYSRQVVEACRRGSGLRPCRLILSKHDYKQTPDDLDAIFAELSASDADVVKVATSARHITDSFRMLEAVRRAGKPAIGICMGAAGVMTRVLAGRVGAHLTFASLEAGAEAAPGQVPVADMLGMYRFRAIGEGTAVLGVAGCPVGHSMSPALHNAAYGRMGLDAVYLPLEVGEGGESFERFLTAARQASWLNLRGLSVTIPHKLDALRLADSVESLAAKIGAANTLALQPGGAIAAYNTDYAGAIRALCEQAGLQVADLAGRRAAVLGAGGVSRALVAGLVDAGCEVTVYNRTLPKAEALAGEFGCNAAEWDARRNLRAGIVVNGTSLGMWPNVHETPLPKEALAPGMIVFDTVYNPPQTRLLLHAARAGCTVVDGVAMFVHQGALQMERWFGRSGGLDTMRQMILDCLRRPPGGQ